jgi:hypothetical protein
MNIKTLPNGDTEGFSFFTTDAVTESPRLADDLLALDDIAGIYRVTYRTARDVVTKRRGFPKPVPGSTKKKPLWLRETIEAYVRGELTHA